MYQRLEELSDRLNNDLSDQENLELYREIINEYTKISTQLARELQERKKEEMIAFSN